MKAINILLVGNPRIKRDYGTQGLIFPLITGLNKYVKANFAFITQEKWFKKDLFFAKKMGIKLIRQKYPFFFLKNKFLKQYLKECDVIIDAEGIEFIGTRSLIKRWFHYIYTVYFQLLAKRYNCLYLKSPKSYGPFPHKIFNLFIKFHLNRLPFILVRGKENLKEIKKLNLKVPVYSVPDVSFALRPTNKQWAKSFLKKRGVDLSKSLIGISPSTVIKNINQEKRPNSCGLNHIVLCKRIIAYFQKKGCQIIILPHSVEDGKNIKSCDLALAKLLLSKLKHKQSVYLIDSLKLNYAQTRAIIGLFDFYITARYHALASALTMSVPVVALSWHNKYKDMLASFLNHYLAIDCEKHDVNSVMNLIKEIYEHKKKWFNKKEILLRYAKILKLVDKSIKMLATEIKRHYYEN